MNKEILQTPEGRATVPPELVVHFIKEFTQLPEGNEEDMWSYVWDRLAEIGNWDSKLKELGLKKWKYLDQFVGLKP